MIKNSREIQNNTNNKSANMVKTQNCAMPRKTTLTIGLTHYNTLTWKYKKAQLSLTKSRDAWEKFARLRKSSGVVSYIASLPIESVPMVSYYVLYSNCVYKMRRFGDTHLLKLPW